MNRVALFAVVAALGAAGIATSATAGTPGRLPTAGSMANAGGASMMSRPTNYSLRDERGNLIMVNGMLQPGGVSSMADAPLPMAGGYSASAVANQLTVLATGSWNTIIVNATQTNTGDITATAGSIQSRDR